MEKFFPQPPKIKYIIPKVMPTSFSLNGESIDDLDIKKDNKFKYNNDSESEKDDGDFDLNNNEKSVNDPNTNSIYITLIKLKARSESNSSIDTKESM